MLRQTLEARLAMMTCLGYIALKPKVGGVDGTHWITEQLRATLSLFVVIHSVFVGILIC